MPDLDHLTPDLLRKLYEEDLLTETQIAKEYGTYQVKISRLRKKWGIPTLGKTGRLEASLPELTQEQRELIMGSLLGDGWMQATSDASARFAEGHSLAQEDYLLWKYELLKPYSSSLTSIQKRTETATFDGKAFSTSSCPQLRPFYDLFYPAPDRKRKFPENLPSLMTPLMLAVWYMDDGSLKSTYHPSITFGLDPDSLEHACDALRDLKLFPQLFENADGTTTISFPGQDREFFDLIKPHVPESMKHKLPPKDSAKREADTNARTLTHEVANALSNRGKTQAEIADMFGVSRSTVSRRLRAPRKRMGRPKGHTLASAHTALRNLSPKDLSPSEKDTVASIAYEVLKTCPFPYPKKMRRAKAMLQLRKLQRKDVWVDPKTREVQPRILTGLRLAEGYFPLRYHARYKKAPSCYEAWFDEDKLKRAIEIQLKCEDPVTPERVRKAIQYQVRTPTNFKPGVAKALYERYAPPQSLVWDPCVGYGGRLLGALAAGVRYVGTDVEEGSISGAKELAEVLDFSSEVRLVQSPAEEFDPQEELSLVFTSPPYFDLERYSENPDQSWMKYGTSLEAWREGFLRPIVKTAYKRLSPKGFIAFNIRDFQTRTETVPLESTVCQVMGEEGFTEYETLKMPLASIGGESKNYEPVFVFRKV